MLLAIGVIASLHFSQRELERTKAEIQAVIDLERQALESGDGELFMSLQDFTNYNWYSYQISRLRSRQWDREHGKLLAPEPEVQVENVELRRDKAWVEVTWTEEEVAYLKVEFYRFINGQWKHAAPDEQYWGKQLEKRTEHILWVYHERDEREVTYLMDRGEEIYQRACSDFGLALGVHPMTIKIIPSITFIPFYPDKPTLTITSPRLWRVRLDGMPDEQLENWLADLLVGYLARQAVGVDPKTIPEDVRCILDAIKGWEIERVAPVRRWISRRETLLARAVQSGELLSLSDVWRAATPLGSAQLNTLIDYIVETYGIKRIPLLLIALGHAQSPEEALREALGAEFNLKGFEEGWLTFVQEKYGRYDPQ
jgi:hypothetical protein